jgi:hypothetical protein
MDRDQRSESSEVRDWVTGIPLWDALGEYTEPALWDEYENICAQVFPALPPNDLPPDPRQYVEIRSGPLPSDPVRLFNQYLSLDAKVKAGITALLGQGKLVALGYRLPRRRTQAPTRISPGSWEAGRISWGDSQLWTQSEAFGEIRVIASTELKAAAVLAEIPSPGPNHKRGRPTWRAEFCLHTGCSGRWRKSTTTCWTEMSLTSVTWFVR